MINIKFVCEQLKSSGSWEEKEHGTCSNLIPGRYMLKAVIFMFSIINLQL